MVSCLYAIEEWTFPAPGTCFYSQMGNNMNSITTVGGAPTVHEQPEQHIAWKSSIFINSLSSGRGKLRNQIAAQTLNLWTYVVSCSDLRPLWNFASHWERQLWKGKLLKSKTTVCTTETVASQVMGTLETLKFQSLLQSNGISLVDEIWPELQLLIIQEESLSLTRHPFGIRKSYYKILNCS